MSTNQTDEAGEQRCAKEFCNLPEGDHSLMKTDHFFTLPAEPSVAVERRCVDCKHAGRIGSQGRCLALANGHWVDNPGADQPPCNHVCTTFEPVDSPLTALEQSVLESVNRIAEKERVDSLRTEEKEGLTR